MSELTGHIHYGYACELRTCSQQFVRPPTGSYFHDRDRNQQQAEAEGWAIFPGRRTILSYCPVHGPAALTRKRRRDAGRTR